METSREESRSGWASQAPRFVWVVAILLSLGAYPPRLMGPEIPPARILPDPGSEPAGSGRFALRITAAGHEWGCLVHVPARYDRDAPSPLVLLLHGAGGSAAPYLDEAGWSDLAEREGVIVVAPEGLAVRPDQEAGSVVNPRLWNSGQHLPGTVRSEVDDLAFFDTLHAEVTSRWRVDPARVYLAGHSNGGSMAFRLASERAGRFTAMAVLAGHWWLTEPEPVRPVPTLLIVGTADPLMPLAGGVSILPWEIRMSPPLERTTTRWCQANGFSDQPSEEIRRPRIVIRDYQAPSGQTGMRVVLLEGHGHGWPGHSSLGPPQGKRAFFGPDTAQVDATGLIWRFFVSQSLPPG